MKSLLQNLTLAFISCLIALLVAEAGLRIMGFAPGSPFDRLLNNTDDLVGYRMTIGAHETIAGPAGAYSVDIVSLGLSEDRGFRDDGIDGPVGSLFFGDSFVWGYGVDLTDSISEQYQNLSGTPAANLGMTAFTSPEQYSRLFAAHGPELPAEYAFFGFFIGNDFGDSTNFDDWLQTDKSASYPEWRTKQIRGIISDDWQTQTRMYAYRRSALWRLASERINFGFGNKKPREDIIEYKNDALDLILTPSQILPTLGPNGDRQIELVTQALLNIKHAANKLQIHPVVFIIPTKELIYQDYLPDNSFSNITDVRYELAIKLLNNSEIDYVDLLPVFRTAVEQGSEQLYFRVDGHWTPAGHRLAAAALHNHIQSLNNHQP